MTQEFTGSCLCGGVQFTLTGPLRPVFGCHCTQCRKTSGHFVAATQVPNERLVLTNHETLTWFRSSDEAERGFCRQCGGNLFWRRHNSTHVSIMAGTIDGDIGLKMTTHKHTGTAGDYYEIP